MEVVQAGGQNLKKTISETPRLLERCEYLGKGQIKSEWIYETINFPKNEPKNLKDFCPMYYKNS